MIKSLRITAPFYLITAFVSAGIFLVPFYRQALDPDGICYISIAQKYMRGEISDAVNACWGPLYSWLQIPLLSLGIDPLLAVKILGVLIGAVSLAGFIALSSKFEINRRLRTILQAAAVPVIMNYSFTLITADLLVLSIVMWYCSVIFDPGYPFSGNRSGIACGILGALAYCAKSYAFPFFAVHFSIMNGIHFIAAADPEKKAKIKKNWLLGMAVFFVMSIFWIGALSYKYGYPTLGTAGRYNFARTGPAYGSQGFSTQTRGQAVLYDGFLDLPNRTAVNSFEDPSLYDRRLWNPFRYFTHYSSVVSENMAEAWKSFLKFSLFSIPVLIISFLLCAGPARRTPAGFVLVSALITLALWTLGFLLIVTEERYLWLDNFILLCLSGVVLTAWGRSRLKPAQFLYVTMVFIVVFSFFVSPFKDLKVKLNAGKDIRDFSVLLKNKYGVGGNLASSRHWHLNFYLAYHLRAKYYGEAGGRYDCALLEKELIKRNIDYFLSWDGSPDANCAFLKTIPVDRQFFLREVVLEGAAHTLTIYRLKNQGS